MHLWQAIVLGIVEGLTEFLPVSSTGHLTIVEKLMGFRIDDAGITAFTAIIQFGAIVALIIYLWRDIVLVIRSFFAGLVNPRRRNQHYRFGWAIIVGSIPIGIVGVLFQHQIEHALRSLWFVGIALIVWSGAMWYADRHAKQNLHDDDLTVKNTWMVGVVQCLSLIPGVSRSGSTLVAGLMRGFDRVAVTRLSFFLAIPALTAATILQVAEQYKDIAAGPGWLATVVATVVSFVVAFGAVSWLLRYVARHTFVVFVWYRVVVGVIVLLLVGTGVVSAS